MRYLLLLLFLVSCASPAVRFEGTVFDVVIADSPDEWGRGLMFRDSLPDGHGMLFIFPDEALRYFWMKNTLIPLDIIFLDEDLSVINIEHAVPCAEEPCAVYGSDAPAKFVLEVNAGAAERAGLRRGSTLLY